MLVKIWNNWKVHHTGDCKIIPLRRAIYSCIHSQAGIAGLTWRYNLIGKLSHVYIRRLVKECLLTHLIYIKGEVTI